MTEQVDRMPGEPLDMELVEFMNNPEPRCACVLLLDTSGSMDGSPIAALNEGVRAFKAALQEDPLAALRVETAIVSFDSQVALVHDFATVDSLDLSDLYAGGSTGTARGVVQALDMIERRKQTYKESGVPYYRPWVICISDGASTDPRPMMQDAIQQIHRAEEAKSVAFFCVGVQGANLDELREMAPARTAMLDGLKFRDFFVWLSSSMTRISSSRVDDEVDLPDISGWARV